jgi:hypothetical protein
MKKRSPALYHLRCQQDDDFWFLDAKRDTDGDLNWSSTRSSKPLKPSWKGTYREVMQVILEDSLEHPSSYTYRKVRVKT